MDARPAAITKHLNPSESIHPKTQTQLTCLESNPCNMTQYKIFRITFLQKTGGGVVILLTSFPKRESRPSLCLVPPPETFSSLSTFNFRLSTSSCPFASSPSLRYTRYLSLHQRYRKCWSSCSPTPPRSRSAPSASASKASASKPIPSPEPPAPPSASPATTAPSTSASSNRSPASSSASPSASPTSSSAATPKPKTPSSASPRRAAMFSSAAPTSRSSPAPAPSKPKPNAWPSPSKSPRPAANSSAAAPTNRALPPTHFKDSASPASKFSPKFAKNTASASSPKPSTTNRSISSSNTPTSSRSAPATCKISLCSNAPAARKNPSSSSAACPPRSTNFSWPPNISCPKETIRSHSANA